MVNALKKRGKFVSIKLDLNGDGMINKIEFHGRTVAMFENMDSNGDDILGDKNRHDVKCNRLI
ncbi:MAG: hypothetical protein CL688_00810 [Candidatus Puniceispirillum sp.]|nr:hypothetical protein [Candidatus Puniceispirillum sp.]